MLNQIAINGVYYVEATGTERTFNPIAIRPRILGLQADGGPDKRCEWEDTLRGSHVRYNKILTKLPEEASDGKLPEKISLLGSEGETVHLVLLTYDLFKEKVAPRVWGELQFSSDEDLQQYFLQTRFEGY